MTLIADVVAELRTGKIVVRSMSRKSRFRRSFDKQHGKCSERLLKS